jgi:putative MFS transporter
VREPSQSDVRWLTRASWLSLVIFAVSSTLVSVSLKRIGGDLGIDFDQRGALAFWRSCALVAAALASGLLADRLGRRWLLTGAMVAVAFGLFWTGRVSTYAGVVAGLVFVGLGLGCLEALVSPLVAELHPGDVTRHMGILHGFYPVGIVLSSLPVGLALDHGMAWQVPFTVAAAPALAIGVMFVAARYPEGGGHRQGSPLALREILANPVFWALAAAMLFGAGCEGGLFYWCPNFVQAEYGMDALAGALAVALFSLAMVAARFGVGGLSRRARMEPLMLGLTVLGTLFSALLAALHSPAATFALIAAGGICVAFLWPGVLALGAQKIATGSSTLFALLAVAGIAGFGLVPYAMGIVAKAHGLRAGMAVVAAAFLVAGLMLRVVFVLSARRQLSGESIRRNPGP